MKAFYPKLPFSDEASLKNLNVRQMKFQANGKAEGHPSPDPLLLVSKAIAVLQKRHGFEIVAPVEPDDDAQHFPGDLSIQAEEEYLRLREEALSEPNLVGLDILIAQTNVPQDQDHQAQCPARMTFEPSEPSSSSRPNALKH